MKEKVISYAQSFERLLNILSELREKCPWDQKQTIQTLRSLSIEELYELVDAIDQENWVNIKEELGDVLLHLVFYSKIAEEKGHFNIHEVIEGLGNKLVQRHPHIYDNLKLAGADEVKKNWEKIKIKEGKNSILEGVPQTLPALTKALRLQEKTKTVGVEWENISQVKAKVEEELAELYAAEKSNNHQDVEEEMGDLLFSLINYARFLKIDPEAALEKTNQKFIRRFQKIEEQLHAQNKSLGNVTLEEMDLIWNNIKIAEKTTNV